MVWKAQPTQCIQLQNTRITTSFLRFREQYYGSARGALGLGRSGRRRARLWQSSMHSPILVQQRDRMMGMQMKDLDQLISERGFADRIEMSATLQEFLAQLEPKSPSRVKTFFRAGLGKWKAIGVEFRGYGDTFVGVPANIQGAGCSIWFRSSEKLTDTVLAGLVHDLWKSNQPEFITLDGQRIAVRSGSGRARKTRVQPVDSHYVTTTA